VDPWPFAGRSVEVRAEGRVLEGPQPDTAALQAALDVAPLRIVKATLNAPG
jgi:hypothetical protein